MTEREYPDLLLRNGDLVLEVNIKEGPVVEVIVNHGLNPTDHPVVLFTRERRIRQVLITHAQAMLELEKRGELRNQKAIQLSRAILSDYSLNVTFAKS